MVLVHGDSCSSGSWWWWCFESGVLRQHSTKCDADTFDDGQEDGATDGINTHGFGPASNRQCASSEEASDNGIPRIFLLPDAFHSAIEAAKEATPYSKVATKDRGARFQSDNGTDASLAMRRIAVEAVSTIWPYDVVVK